MLACINCCESACAAMMCIAGSIFTSVERPSMLAPGAEWYPRLNMAAATKNAAESCKAARGDIPVTGLRCVHLLSQF